MVRSRLTRASATIVRTSGPTSSARSAGGSTVGAAGGVGGSGGGTTEMWRATAGLGAGRGRGLGALGAAGAVGGLTPVVRASRAVPGLAPGLLVADDFDPDKGPCAIP